MPSHCSPIGEFLGIRPLSATRAQSSGIVHICGLLGPFLAAAKIPFTLPMAKTKTMVLVFGFSFPFSVVSKEKVVLVSAKVVLVFGFSFALGEGVGVFLPPLTFVKGIFVAK